MPDAPIERLSLAVAVALDDAAVRASVHRAMQASPYLDHELVLQDYLARAAGEPLRTALVDHAGGEDALAALLNDLPGRMDFYVPFEKHQATWEHAEDDLTVVTTEDPDAQEGTGWRADGTRLFLASEGVLPLAEVAAMFVLHPEEPEGEHGHAPHEGVTIHAARKASPDAVEFNPSCEYCIEWHGAGFPSGSGTSGTSDVLHVDSNRLNARGYEKYEITDLFPWRVNGGASHLLHLDLWEEDGGLLGGDDHLGDVRAFCEHPVRNQPRIGYEVVRDDPDDNVFIGLLMHGGPLPCSYHGTSNSEIASNDA